METLKLSDNSLNALAKLKALYNEGKVFVTKGNPEVQRTCEVYMCACSVADEIGKDMASYLGTEALGYGRYEIISNMKVIIKQPVGGHNGQASGYCAVGVHDYDSKTSYYLGITKC